MSLKLLAKTDKRTKYSVYGWIRKMEKKLKIKPIPIMLSAIAILYFREEDIFDAAKISSHVRMSADAKCITKYRNRTTYNNYGIVRIASIYDVEYRWDFVLNSIVGGKIEIGVASKACKYMFIFKRGLYYKPKAMSGVPFDSGDTISLHLDLEIKELYVCNQDKKQKILSYEDIETGDNIKYRLLVRVERVDESVEIVDFSSC